jgi:hypothetical protein
LKKINFGFLVIIGILMLVVFASGCTSSNNNSTVNNTSTGVQSSQSSQSGSGTSNQYNTVHVDYAGSFSGSITDSGGTRTVQGTGPQSFQLSMNPGNVGMTIQKKDNGNGTLTVSILDINANTLKTNSTNAAFGVVSLSYTF